MGVPHKSSLSSASKAGATLPDFPKLSPEMSKLPGVEEFAVQLGRWNGLMKKRWTGLDKDITKGVSVVEHSVELLNGYSESGWTLQVTAAGVVTGIQVFSSDNPETAEQISYVAIQADRFQINTATAGNKQIFSATASDIKLGDVLTVDLDGQKLFIGDGNFEDANTAFFVDAIGRLSLKDTFSFDGTTLVISGTGTAGNYVSISDFGLQVGDDPTEGTVHISNNSGIPYLNLRYNGDVYGTWSVSPTKSVMQLSDDSGHAVNIDGNGNIAILGAPATFGLSLTNDLLVLGTPWIGVHSALAAETVTGYLTINDQAGTVRKIAVVS